MGRFVLAAYEPRSGKESQLLQIVARHESVLRREKLITDRPAYVMRAANDTIIEVFEWASPGTIGQAHHNPAVQALWNEFSEACVCPTLDSLSECKGRFAEFESVSLSV